MRPEINLTMACNYYVNDLLAREDDVKKRDMLEWPKHVWFYLHCSKL